MFGITLKWDIQALDENNKDKDVETSLGVHLKKTFSLGRSGKGQGCGI